METTLMTLEEVANYLRVSERTVKEWATSGELPGGKLGASWRFRKEDIDSWLDKQLTPHKHSKSSNLELSIRNLIDPSRIFLVDYRTKMELLNFLISQAATLPGVGSRAEIADATFKREDLMSTGIGLGIAVPHVRLNNIKDLNIFVAVNQSGIEDYNSIDGAPVRVAVYFVVGRNQHSEYIKALAVILEHLKNTLSFKRILDSQTPQDVYKILVGEP